jgi:hypothetical protein
MQRWVYRIGVTLIVSIAVHWALVELSQRPGPIGRHARGTCAQCHY